MGYNYFIHYTVCFLWNRRQCIWTWTVIEPAQPAALVPVPVRILMLFVLLWQAVFHVSDAALAMLVIFLHHFFRVLSALEESNALRVLVNAWPKSVKAIHRAMGIERQNFTQYVVCPKCHSVYELGKCIVTRNGRKISKLCEHCPFPQQPRSTYRRSCGALLLRSVKTKTGNILRLIKVYCYHILITSLKQLLAKPKMLELCEHWRGRASNLCSDVLGDIYDGQIWKDFQYVNGKPFLAHPYNLLLSLNTDWFQPFTHTAFSVGAIYIVVQNLPRNIRYKPENIILCGIIHGPREPKHTIKSYISPLVEELLYIALGRCSDTVVWIYCKCNCSCCTHLHCM